MNIEQKISRKNIKKKYGKRIIFLLIALVLISSIITIIFSHILLPAIVRGKIERKIFSMIRGSIEIENVETSLWGPFNIEGIKVFDEENKQLLSIQKVKAIMANWPGLKPSIKELEVETCSLHGEIKNGKISFPKTLISKKTKQAGKRLNSFHKLQIHNSSIDLDADPNSKILCDYLLAERSERDGFYNILLTTTNPENADKNDIEVNGVINPSSREISLSLEIEKSVLKQETCFIFNALGIPHVSGQGELVADVNIAGNLNEPLTLQSTGNAKINQWDIYIKDDLFAEKIAVSASLNKEIIDINMTSGLLCDGTMKGSLAAEIIQKKTFILNGQFAADKVNFKKLLSFYSDSESKNSNSMLEVNYAFRAEGYDLQKLKGSGQVILDNADLSVVPVVPFLFDSIGLSKLDPLTLSDAECTFDTTGPVLKLTSAHISNPVSAIQAEPGGTINLQTGELDFYVVAVLIPLVSNIIEDLPVVDIVFNLKDKLTRLYVKGNWSSPPSELITKTPVKDIEEGTVGFFQDVVRNGGNFGQGMLNGFKSIFSFGKNKDSDKKK